MREIIVLSGKGGTGKTTLTASLAHLAQGQAVLADLDVDAANLHLVLHPRVEHREDFVSGHVARVEPSRCSGCGGCVQVCRFAAVHLGEDGSAVVDPRRCEGCKTCVALCPEAAIAFEPRYCGVWMRSHTRFGPMVHARLEPGGENSGRLVSVVKQQARQWAAHLGRELIVADGAPGIGCPVIASLSQAHLAVVVTEPSPSGVHDLGRVAAVCARFRIPVAVVLNKWDLAPDMAAEVETLCAKQGWTFLGRLPHDTTVPWAMAQGMAVTETQGPWAQAVRTMWPTLLHNIMHSQGGI